MAKQNGKTKVDPRDASLLAGKFGKHGADGTADLDTRSAAELDTPAPNAGLADYEGADEGVLLDGEAKLRELMTDPSLGYEVAKVVKLEPGRALEGTFRGYAPAEIASPGTGEIHLMNLVCIEVRPGAIAKILGAAQIMQQLQSARPGDEILIVRLNSPDIEIGNGRRVRPYTVAVKPRVSGQSALLATPVGKWGAKQLTAQVQAPALPSGN